MSKNDGGPAFPITQEGAIEVILERGHSPEGMTMRQYYKAAALEGMMANNEILERITESDGMKFEFLAKSTGEIADAMIAEDEEAAKNE